MTLGIFALHALLLMIWVGCCALQDWRSKKIANLLTIGGGFLALIYLCWNARSWLGSPWQLTLGGILLCLLIALPGYKSRQFGAADVKLMLAIAIATDLTVTLMTFIGAGVVFLASLAYRPCRRTNPAKPSAIVKQPYAPAVFLGLAVALLINQL